MKFIKNFPALFIQKIKALVIADLHIGLKYELSKSGINIPSPIEKIKDDIDHLLNLTRASTLVILGDIKHKVPGISWQEIKDIPKLFEHLSSKVKVIVCKGNHDDRIEEIIPSRVKIHTSKGFRIKDFGFIHGHAWPSKKLLTCDYLILGHAHPMVQFKDKFGYRILEQVWVKGKIDKEKIKERYKVKKTGKLEVIIVPAFNRLLGGTPVNVKRVNDKLLGPLMKNEIIDMSNAELYLLDGTYLGKLKNLMRY